MDIRFVLLPLFVHVVLTFLMLLRASGVRVGPAPGGTAAYRETNWIELALLFYVLTILAQITRRADIVYVLLAWVFVALCLIDAFVYVTGERGLRRGSLFMASVIVLAVMWAIYIVSLLLGL